MRGEWRAPTPVGHSTGGGYRPYDTVSRGADNPEVDYLAGVITQRYGRLREALAAYRKAADRNPRDAHYLAAVAETLVALDSTQEAL